MGCAQIGRKQPDNSFEKSPTTGPKRTECHIVVRQVFRDTKYVIQLLSPSHEEQVSSLTGANEA